MGTHPIFESDFDCLTDMSSKEEIVQGFQNLCQEQRGLQQKLAELRQERGEHELVAETLKKAEPERKAWRLVGGVLTERTVGEVLPALQSKLDSRSIKSRSTRIIWTSSRCRCPCQINNLFCLNLHGTIWAILV